jgi:hypothetical protein
VPELPLRGWVLLAALVAISAAVLSVLYWAQFTGRAGTQRGLVIHNDLNYAIRLEVFDSQRQVRVVESILPDDEHTFVVKRDEFPVAFHWGTYEGTTFSATSSPLITYREVADAEFRLSIDEQGLHPTATYRDATEGR